MKAQELQSGTCKKRECKFQSKVKLFLVKIKGQGQFLILTDFDRSPSSKYKGYCHATPLIVELALAWLWVILNSNKPI